MTLFMKRKLEGFFIIFKYMQRKKNEYFEIFLETLSNEVKFL